MEFNNAIICIDVLLYCLGSVIARNIYVYLDSTLPYTMEAFSLVLGFAMLCSPPPIPHNPH